jgi:hypothetical protein
MTLTDVLSDTEHYLSRLPAQGFTGVLLQRHRAARGCSTTITSFKSFRIKTHRLNKASKTQNIISGHIFKHSAEYFYFLFLCFSIFSDHGGHTGLNVVTVAVVHSDGDKHTTGTK